MDEVFGEHNFATLMTRRAMHTVRNSSKDFNKNADYVLTYCNNKELTDSDPNKRFLSIKDKTKDYPYDDNDGRGRYKLDPLHARNYAKPYEYTFLNGVTWKCANGRYPLYAVETLRKMDLENRIDFRRSEPQAKRYLEEVQEGQPPNSIIDYLGLEDVLKESDVKFNKDGSSRVSEIFGQSFKYQPKPIEFLEYLIGLTNRQKDLIILDAFAGTGSTGDAVLSFNIKHKTNHQFILIQMDEEVRDLQESAEALKAGFTTVDAITRERLRRVIDGVPSAKDAQLQQGLGGSFTAVTLGEPINLETLALATDETLPSRENLGRFVFYNTTLQALATLPTENATGYLGETATHKVYLLYKPERQALTGTTCAFTLERAERIARELAGTGKEAIVYAPISFVDAKTLKAKKWAIRYCNLPYELLQLNPVKPAPEGLV
jgi:hypothetical protein